MPVTIKAYEPTANFEVQITIENTDGVNKTIGILLANGYKPHPANIETQLSPEGLPICKKHNIIMKQRNMQGDTWYSHKVIDTNGEEHWCRGGPHPRLSPGWDIPHQQIAAIR